MTLGPEIWEQTAGTVTHFVAAGSTGGTVSGTGRFLKERDAGVRERPGPAAEAAVLAKLAPPRPRVRPCE